MDKQTKPLVQKEYAEREKPTFGTSGKQLEMPWKATLVLMSRDGGEAKMPRTRPAVFGVLVADQADVGLSFLFVFFGFFRTRMALEEPCALPGDLD